MFVNTINAGDSGNIFQKCFCQRLNQGESVHFVIPGSAAGFCYIPCSPQTQMSSPLLDKYAPILREQSKTGLGLTRFCSCCIPSGFTPALGDMGQRSYSAQQGHGTSSRRERNEVLLQGKSPHPRVTQVSWWEALRFLPSAHTQLPNPPQTGLLLLCSPGVRKPSEQEHQEQARLGNAAMPKRDAWIPGYRKSSTHLWGVGIPSNTCTLKEELSIRNSSGEGTHS